MRKCFVQGKDRLFLKDKKIINQDLLLYSRDCPIFYMRTKIRLELETQEKRVQRFGLPEW